MQVIDADWNNWEGSAPLQVLSFFLQLMLTHPPPWIVLSLTKLMPAHPKLYSLARPEKSVIPDGSLNATHYYFRPARPEKVFYWCHPLSPTLHADSMRDMRPPICRTEKRFRRKSNLKEKGPLMAYFLGLSNLFREMIKNTSYLDQIELILRYKRRIGRYDRQYPFLIKGKGFSDLNIFPIYKWNWKRSLVQMQTCQM